MSSLERAIKSSAIPVRESSGMVVIDRSNFASRKRGRIASVSSATKEFPDFASLVKADSSPSAEADFWREKYETLRALQEESQQELEKELEVSQQKEKKLEQMIVLLKKKGESTNVNGKADKENNIVGNANTGNSLTGNNDVELQRLQTLVKFYERMTAMTIVADKSNAKKMNCTVKNKIQRKLIKFSVEESEDGSVNYTPVANSDFLPEYLQNEISFEVNMAPVVMGDVLSNLYDEGQ